MTALTIQAPHLPIIVVGSVKDESFAVETINAGAQGYLAREEFQPHLMRRTIRCAVERQIERVALVAEKENYYGIFDHLIEGIFRTTPDGHYMMANIALARIYGYNSPADLIANVTDIAHSLYVETGRREEFVQLMQGNDVITGEKTSGNAPVTKLSCHRLGRIVVIAPPACSVVCDVTA